MNTHNEDKCIRRKRPMKLSSFGEWHTCGISLSFRSKRNWFEIPSLHMDFFMPEKTPVARGVGGWQLRKGMNNSNRGVLFLNGKGAEEL